MSTALLERPVSTGKGQMFMCEGGVVYPSAGRRGFALPGAFDLPSEPARVAKAVRVDETKVLDW